MSTISDIIEKMRPRPDSVRFSDLYKVCTKYFGEPRDSGGSHVIFKLPWPGDPRINIQNKTVWRTHFR